MKTLFRIRLAPMQTATAITFALFVATTPLLLAQPNPDHPNRPDQPADEGRRMQRPQGLQPDGPGGFRGGQGLPMLEQVLTEDQRDSIRKTREAQREKMRDLQEKIRDARKAMMTAAFAGDYKEKAVHAKALKVAKLEADLTVLRLKAIAEVQPALSKEQLEKIMNPPPPQGLGPEGAGPRPGRRANRSPDEPRDGDDIPQPPKRDPQ